MRYTATRHQFGGPARANLGGAMDLMARGGDPAPCSYAGGANLQCLGTAFLGTQAPTGVVGAAFGDSVMVERTGPASGKLFVTVTAAGSVVNATPTPGMGPGLANHATSFGGPWTTGMLTVSVSFAPLGISPEYFILSGSDQRTPQGRGQVSLVSGAVVQSTLVGRHPTAAWLNLDIGPRVGVKVPALPAGAAVALAVLSALSGAWVLRRR